MRVGGQRHVLAPLPPGERRGVDCKRGWVGPWNGLDGPENLPSPPVANRYSDCAITAHQVKLWLFKFVIQQFEVKIVLNH